MPGSFTVVHTNTQDEFLCEFANSLPETPLLPLVLTPTQPPLGIPHVKGAQKAPGSRGPPLLGSLVAQQAALCPVGPQ